MSDELFFFATIADVAPALSGHENRFESAEDFSVACRAVWRAAILTGDHFVIGRDYADAIMEAALVKIGLSQSG